MFVDTPCSSENCCDTPDVGTTADPFAHRLRTSTNPHNFPRATRSRGRCPLVLYGTGAHALRSYSTAVGIRSVGRHEGVNQWTVDSQSMAASPSSQAAGPASGEV